MTVNELLPVGTKIAYKDCDGNIATCHVIGNYSLTDGEVRTARDGMIHCSDITEIHNDSEYLEFAKSLNEGLEKHGLPKDPIAVWELLWWHYNKREYNISKNYPLKSRPWGYTRNEVTKPSKVTQPTKKVVAFLKELTPLFWYKAFINCALGIDPRLPKE